MAWALEPPYPNELILARRRANPESGQGMAVREAFTLNPVKSTRQDRSRQSIGSVVEYHYGSVDIFDIFAKDPVMRELRLGAKLTFGVGFYKERGSWDDALFHGHDHFQETRITSCWLGVANVALDRADEEWLVRRTRLREDGTYTPDFSRVTSLSASAMALQVSCFV